MRGKRATDLAIPALATHQHGVVSRAQLRTAGLHDRAIDRRIASGRLHPVYRGVFAVGHTDLTVKGRWMAAVLASGDDAVLSHTSAAAAWDLRPTGTGSVHVTVPGTPGRRRRAGIRLHRSAMLAAEEATVHDGIPITDPARTLIDLATLLRGRPLEQALDRSEQLGLVDFADLERRMARHPTRPGTPSLRALLSSYTVGAFVTRSEMEERFLDLCDDHALPRPEVNTLIEGKEVDFVWRGARLIVEVDGYAYHRSPSAFEEDRERDVVLAVAGWQVLRFTWAQVTARSEWVAAAITSRLSTLPRYPR
jgi:very-short-patch-repair endonuclease